MTDNEVARKDEVLAALTRILRREATESAIVTTRERVPTLCADGKVRYSERTDTRVVEIPPKISDVNRAADLLGRRCGLWDEAPETRGEAVCIVDDVISTGESLYALEALVESAKGIVTRKAAVLAEGKAAERDDIIFLQKLPLFHKCDDNSYEIKES